MKELGYTDPESDGRVPVLTLDDGQEPEGEIEDAPDTVDEILEWVGQDAERAEIAAKAELVQEEPRVTLLRGLRGLVAGDAILGRIDGALEALDK